MKVKAARSFIEWAAFLIRMFLFRFNLFHLRRS